MAPTDNGTTLTFPPGAVQTFRPNSTNRYDIPWKNVSRWEPWFSEAAAESNVPAQFIAAMAVVESDANHTWPSGPNEGQVIEVDDPFGDGPAVGIMQVKPRLWQFLLPDADAYTPQGNIRLGARLLGYFIDKTGSWEKAITHNLHPPSPDMGQYPQMLIKTINSLMAELAASEANADMKL